MGETITIQRHEVTPDHAGDLPRRWQQCLSRCPERLHLFSWDWHLAWLRAYASSAPWTGSMRVYEAIGSDDAPVAMLPLAARRQQGLKVNSLAGFYQPFRAFVCDPSAAPAASEALVRAAVQEPAAWDVLRLDPFDTATAERKALLEALQAHTRVLLVPRGQTVVNTIDRDFDAYRASRTGKRIRSYENRFGRQPGAEIRHFAGITGEAAAAMLRDLGAVEQHSWLAREGGDLRFASERDQGFWAGLLAGPLGEKKQFEAWIAYGEDRPAAFRVALTAGEFSYMIANQYDEAFAEYRLGWILYLRHLESAIARGVKFIDSAPGDIHYKGRLGGREAEMRYGVFAFRKTAKGFALEQVFRTLQGLHSRLGEHRWGARLARRLPRL